MVHVVSAIAIACITFVTSHLLQPYTMDAKWYSKLETQRQRVEFARQLKAIPILQRHDILAAIASRVASSKSCGHNAV